MIECDNIFRPELTAEFSSHQVKHFMSSRFRQCINFFCQGKANMSRLSLSVVFRRSSALFQLQLGMVLRFIASQQLGQSLLVLQLQIHNHLM